jgi:PAS domain S-box-containing protein
MSPIRNADGAINTLLVNAWDVTKRTLAEHALRENSRILQESQAIAHLGSWTADLQSGTFDVTPEAARIIGWKPGLLRIEELMEIVHPEDRTLMKNAWDTALKNGSYEIEHRIFLAGEVRWVHVKAVFNLAEDGCPVTALGITQDITERKRADAALVASEEKYRGLVKSLDSILYTVDFDGRLLYINDLAAELLGSTPSDCINKNVFDIFPEDIASKRLQSLRKVMQEDKGITVESEGMVQGHRRWYRTTIQPIHDSAGQVIYALVNSTDIHDLKMAQHEILAWSQILEERVKERTVEIQDLYDNAPTGYHSVDIDGNFVMINKTELRWLGYTHEEVLGHAAIEFMVPSSRAVYLEKFAEFKAQGWLKDVELEFVRKDGSLLPVSLSSIAVYDRHGNYSFSRSTVFDNTERKRAEQELRESEERYRKAISAADAVPYSLDYASNTYTFMGEGIEKISGYNQEEMTPTLFEMLIAQTSMQGDLRSLSTEEATRQIREGETDAAKAVWRSDFLIQHKNGEERWLSDISLQVLDTNGKVTGSIGILQNITDRKKAEEVLRLANIEMERALQIKDEFLTSMSHELRTPLTGILGLSEALQYETYGGLNNDQKNALVNIEQSGRHLLDLINDILDISKLEAGKLDIHMEPLPISEICDAALQLTKGMAHKKNQTMAYSMEPASIMVLGDARRLKQILVNLLSNAIKYSHENSKIGLEVNADQLSGTVRLTVWDNGIGISEEDLKKLFKPFVQLDSSLTRQQNGTGLGLALVQRLVNLHDGKLEVESTPGQGSRFTVILSTLPANAIKARRKSMSLLAQPQLAFIIDDNRLDSDRLRQSLKVLGIEAEIYARGAGAVDRALEIRPDMIFLDLLLPDISGWDIMDQLRQNDATSRIPIIVTSVVDEQEYAFQRGASGYLLKFFTQSDLYLAIEQSQNALDGSKKDKPTTSLSDPLSAKVMVVDDNEINIFMLHDYLKSKHFSVVTARSGFECLSRIAEIQPDIVLMDIQMPGMDGLETMRHIRSNPDPSISTTPVIAITALAMPGDRERCLQAGANEYISKPMHLEQLSTAIRKMLEKES